MVNFCRCRSRTTQGLCWPCPRPASRGRPCAPAATATGCWSRSATTAPASPKRPPPTSWSPSTPSRSAGAPAWGSTSAGGSSSSATTATCASPQPPAAPASRCCCRSPRAGDPPGLDRLAQVPAVGGDRPDHEDVQGDDDQRPERVVGDEQEVGDGAEHGQGDGRGTGPGPARQQSPAGEGHQQPEDQVDPAPGGGVQLEQVVAGGDIELVLEDGHQALQRLPDADHDHHEAGEQNEAHRPAAGGLVWSTRGRILRRPLLSHLPFPSSGALPAAAIIGSAGLGAWSAVVLHRPG